MPVDRVKQRLAELHELKNRILQECATVDVQRAQLDEIRGILADFEPFLERLVRRNQFQVMRRFIRCIDVRVTNIVIHWRFSENECKVSRSEVSPGKGKKGVSGRVVEIGRLELPTSCMPCRRSPS